MSELNEWFYERSKEEEKIIMEEDKIIVEEDKICNEQKELVNNFLENHFTQTFLNNNWQSEESRSGPGSEKNSSLVKNCIYSLKDFINLNLNDKETITIADIPCGDFNWINLLLEEILINTKCKKINYYGYDIVENLELKFNDLYKLDNVNYYFKVFDATNNIPVKADIILCKEMFIHLSYKHINACISNFKKSESTFLMCSDSDNIPNKDIKYLCYGECRDVSLLLEPFNLPKPIYELSCYKIWDLKDI